MIPVKVCGITNVEDGKLAVNCGASAIGLIFYEKSPRYIHPEKAKEITRALPDSISKVGVFVNSPIDSINSIIEKTGINFAQLHGDETPEFFGKIPLPVIKAMQVSDSLNLEKRLDFDVHALLLDSYHPTQYGGTGNTFDWTKHDWSKLELPLILSGGIAPENVLAGINALNPEAVDVNSGVETSPGKKDEEKMVAFFNVLKETKSESNIFNLETVEESSID